MKKNSIYKLLNKDIKDLNKIAISLSCAVFLFTVGLISYKASSSYALFQDELTGDETIIVEAKSNYDKNFRYIGKPEEYTVQKDGYYYIEMAGAQGGSSYAEYNATYSGGKGSKTSGYIELKAGEKLYFYVGGQGKRCVCSSAKNCCGSNGGYNGGGYTLQYTGGNTYYGSGGGATDVRVVSGSWNTTSSLISRIMVAAGGGGARRPPLRRRSQHRQRGVGRGADREESPVRIPWHPAECRGKRQQPWLF